MSKIVYPSWLPRLVNPVVMDNAGDLRQLRGDYNGGAYAAYAGSLDTVKRENLYLLTVALGTATIYSTAVPVGYRHVYQRLCCFHADTAARQATLMLYSGGVLAYLTYQVALAPNQEMSLASEVVLGANEQLRLDVYAVAAGKYVYLSLAGYSVRL